MKVTVDSWTAHVKIFSSSDPEPAVVALRLLNYPAWRVELDGSNIPAASIPETGQMLIAIPAGAHRIVVRFSRTWDRVVGLAVSLAFLLILSAFMFATKRGAITSKIGAQ